MEQLQSLATLREQVVNIKVVGVGGGGSNAVDRMIAEHVGGVEFIAVNTDAQALQHSAAPVHVQIGGELTRGMGSGGNPQSGQAAAEETRADLAHSLRGADMVFIAAGMGGGTGTGAAPVVASIAQESGALTVGVVTLPFGFEGSHRRKMAEQGIEQLRPHVDTLIIIPNDRLIQSVQRHTTMLEAFRLTDRVLQHGIQGISDLITRRGIINVDFADARAIMEKAGTAWMAIGTASGPNRMIAAVSHALSSPLLDINIAGARGVLCNIVGGPDLALAEMNDGLDIVRSTVDADANIIHGVVIDPALQTGEVMVTLIATGFDQRKQQPAPRLLTRSKRQSKPQPQPKPEHTQAAQAEPLEPLEQPRRGEYLAAARSTPFSIGRGHDADLDMPPFLRRRSSRSQPHSSEGAGELC